MSTNLPPRAEDRMPWWLIALAVAAALAVLAVVVLAVGPDRSDGDAAPSDTTTDDPDDAPADTPEGAAVDAVLPSGRVAYVDAAGRVLVGTGAEEPVEVAADAALGVAGLASVAIAPTSDLLAYVRPDGALVVVPLGVGDAPAGDARVVATDVAIDAVGTGRALAWDATGSRLAYLAVGTEAMVEPRPAEPPPLSNFTGVYRVPLPEGVLGNVVKVVERDGTEVVRIGDPSTRSMVGVVLSGSDDLMLLESVAPDTGLPYTLAVATVGAAEETPTLLSADEPGFAPDGNFIVAVGPARDGSELLRIATDGFSRATLAAGDEICNPSISPDSTRIVYAAGENCSELKLISSRGGTPIDVTPPAGPGDRTFRHGELGWTVEGRYVTFADCRATEGPVRCDGPVTFLEPDQRRVIAGPVATTVAPHNRPLLQDLQLDLVMSGPIEYAVDYPVTSELEGELVADDGDGARVQATLQDGERTLAIDVQVQQGSQFATGQLTVVDPAAGIDRTFLVLGTPVVLGTRVVSLSGMWVSTDELPVVSGEFRLGVRRG